METNNRSSSIQGVNEAIETSNAGPTNNLFKLRLNGKVVDCPSANPNGAEILGLFGLVPPEDYELLLKLTNREFEPVISTERVDLSTPGIEKFLAKMREKAVVFVDAEPVVLVDCFSTPSEILTKSGKDPARYYLKQIVGHREITYKRDPDYSITITKGLRFSTCRLEPTPVS